MKGLPFSETQFPFNQLTVEESEAQRDLFVFVCLFKRAGEGERKKH